MPRTRLFREAGYWVTDNVFWAHFFGTSMKRAKLHEDRECIAFARPDPISASLSDARAMERRGARLCKRCGGMK